MEEEELASPSVLQKEIFGDSDDSISENSQNAEEEKLMDEDVEGEVEEENIPEPSSDSSESEPEHEEEPEKKEKGKASMDSGETDKILEARREFEAAMEKIKPNSRRGQKLFDTGVPVDLDEIAQKFVRRMIKAADSDADAVEAGKPGLEKQKMLSEVLDMMTKKHYHEVLLDNEILVAVRHWMEPLPNRTLPSPNIRKSLLEALKLLPIETVHLRESGLGKIVNFFSQRTGELDDIRRLSSDLVGCWSRPILQRASFRPSKDDEDGDEGDRSVTGNVIRSESLRHAAKKYSGGQMETRQQKKIVQNLAKKRSKTNPF